MFCPIFDHLLNSYSDDVDDKNDKNTVEDQTDLEVNQDTQKNKESPETLNNKICLSPLSKISQDNLSLI